MKGVTLYFLEFLKITIVNGGEKSVIHRQMSLPTDCFASAPSLLSKVFQL